MTRSGLNYCCRQTSANKRRLILRVGECSSDAFGHVLSEIHLFLRQLRETSRKHSTKAIGNVGSFGISLTWPQRSRVYRLTCIESAGGTLQHEHLHISRNEASR